LLLGGRKFLSIPAKFPPYGSDKGVPGRGGKKKGIIEPGGEKFMGIKVSLTRGRRKEGLPKTVSAQLEKKRKGETGPDSCLYLMLRENSKEK